MVKCMTANCQYFIVKSKSFSVCICTNRVNKSAIVPGMRVYEVTLQNRCGTTDDFGNFSPPCFVFQLPWLSCTKANPSHSSFTYDMRTCWPFLDYYLNVFEHVNDCVKYKKIEIFNNERFSFYCFETTGVNSDMSKFVNCPVYDEKPFFLLAIPLTSQYTLIRV